MELPSIIQSYDASESNGSRPFDGIQKGETIYHTIDNVTLMFNDYEDVYGLGTLEITTKRVVFHNKNSSGGVISVLCIQFPDIMSHSIIKQTEYEGRSCLQCQLDTDEDIHEMRLFPIMKPTDDLHNSLTIHTNIEVPNDSDLEKMYKGFSFCSKLNPDPEQPDLEEVMGERIFFDAATDQDSLTEHQAKKLKRLDDLLQVPEGILDGVNETERSVPGQFDDDDSMEQ
eukprot:TRINITY_DN4855_c0_g1_i1.p1 TRINITY_DN4855_c0_g1~~TRINITY_DN4855_c0_g1_i1.p1  ORF type:complete len:228 (+),score=21.50 TRINITY_DN4855_c0_g1_i1:2-685(+)